MGRPLFAALMALALAMRIAIPAGFMPTASDGAVVVSICTGEGALSHVIDLGAKGGNEKQQDGQGHCLFAAAAGGAPGPGPIGDIAALWFPATAAIGTAIADLTVHRLAAPPPPSQAPPARA